jgi:hypothetical protein
MNAVLQVDVERAAQMHHVIAAALVGPYPADARPRLFGSFMSMCLSHHESILVLVQNEMLTGSALALFRPLVETAYRGLFVGLIATDHEVYQVMNDDAPYPRFNDLAALIDERLKTSTLYSQFGGSVWKMLCDYTHTGVIQLASRIDQNGLVGSHYAVEQLQNLVNGATSILVQISIPFLQKLRGEDQAAIVGREYVRLYVPQPGP